jgi:Flp pilus assembly protein TadD
MLDGLDKIDWASLQHAYGSAADVPDMIRRLASSDDEARSEALHDAYGNIFHQGTRYTATPKAIPFLIKIAGRHDGDHDAAVELLELITHCVAGYFDAVFGPKTGSGTIWGAATRPMQDYGETLELLKECETTAEPAMSVCIRLLGERAAAPRMASLRLIAALHAYADRYEMVPRLEGLYASERDSHVRAMIAFALTHVLPVGKEALLVEIARADADELVRLVATMGCIRRGVATSDSTAQMIQWLDDDELADRYAELPCHSNDLAGDLGSMLAQLDRSVLAAALPALVTNLRNADDFGVCGVLSAALAAVFGDDSAPTDATALTADQRRVLETLVHNQGFWALGNAMSILDRHGVASVRESLATYLGIEATVDPVEQARIGARAFASFGAERAVQEWEEVLEQYPDDAEAACQLGVLYMQLGNEDARELLELGLAKAAAVKGDVAGRAYFALGVLHHQQGDVEEALDAFTRAHPLLRGSDRKQARDNRITILQATGRAPEALAILEETPARTTDDHYSLGLAQVKAGKYAESIASITRVLEVEPDHALAHYTIACAHALSGDADRALTSIEQALTSDPDLGPDIAGDSDFASIANDPRFQTLVGGD